MPLVNINNLSPSLSHVPPMQYLPFDLIPEILCRLPVKFLFQLRCVCKSWNSLISDPKFAKKHLHLSNTFRIHDFKYDQFSKLVVKSYNKFDYVFNTTDTNITTNNDTNAKSKIFSYILGSCNGIICLAPDDKNFVLLWNPSIKKLKILPRFDKPLTPIMMMAGFGYDSFNDNYKVVIVLRPPDKPAAEVMVHTLGTNFWKNIQKFSFKVVQRWSGNFVRGTINWLASESDTSKSQCFIYSLDLGNESYQKISVPDYGEIDSKYLYLGVLRECLCMVSNHVWLMKEYGNKESWTKLFTISYMGDPTSQSYSSTKVLYIFEDDQVLLESIEELEEPERKFILYNSRDGTFKVTGFTNIPHVYVESLISPCSLC